MNSNFLTTVGLLLAVASLTNLSGCRHRKIESGLEVSKVPLNARMANADHGVEGFRYYLTRPYVTVSKRLEVATTYDVCQEENGKLKSLSSGNTYDLKGQAIASYAMTGSAPSLQGALRAEHGDELLEGIEAVKKSVSDVRKRVNKIDGTTASIKTDTAALVEASNASPAGIPSEVTVNVFQKNEPGNGNGNGNAEIQVVYLPDFEEQLAIKHKNRLSTSKFAINFKNGSELSNVAGSFNSAEVPIKIAQTISTAIEAAAAVASKALTTLPITPSGALIKSDVVDRNKDFPLVLVAQTSFIEPGIYRLQKQSEMTCDASSGQHFLTELGLPLTTDLQVYLLDENEEGN